MRPIFKHCLLVSLLILAAVYCLGCTSTYVGGGDDSPDGKYVATVYVRGAGGHAYLEDTKKTVYVTLGTKDKVRGTVVKNTHNGAITSETFVAVNGTPGKSLLDKKYHIQGSGVRWDASWGKGDELTLSFYDYGPGVYWEDALKN